MWFDACAYCPNDLLIIVVVVVVVVVGEFAELWYMSAAAGDLSVERCVVGYGEAAFVELLELYV